MPLAIPTNITQTGNGQNLYLLESDAGSGGAGVVQLVAGTNVTLSPPTGEGIVTINATSTPPPVTKLVAGSNITLSPSTGLGEVTITASGGGGGAVSSVAGTGAGINVTPTTGAVVVSNTGVTSLVAGNNVTVSNPTGAVTVSVATTTNNPFIPKVAIVGNADASPLQENAPYVNLPVGATEYPGWIQINIPGNQVGTNGSLTFNNSGWFALPVIAGFLPFPSPSYFAVNVGSVSGATGYYQIQMNNSPSLIRGVNCWVYFINGEKATAPGGFPASLVCLKFEDSVRA